MMNAWKKRSGWCAVPLLFLSLGWVAESAQADIESEAAAAAKDLLEVGWRTTPDARREIDERFAAIPPELRTDARVAYAYALALIKLRREADAARVIETMAEASAPSSELLRSRLWLTMLTRQYDSALVQMQRVAELLAEQVADAPGVEHRASARRLGMMIGFLEGPAEGSVPPTKVDDYRRRISNRLPETLAEDFVEGRQAVEQQHDQWLAQQMAADELAEQQAEAERRRLLESAQAERDQIGVRRRELAAQMQKLREDFGSELESLRAAERPLAEQLAVAVLQGRRVQDELLGVLDEIARLTDRLRRTRDPELRRLLLIDIDRLERIAARIRIQLDHVEREIAILEARVLEIRQQAEAVRVRYTREMGARDKDEQSLARREGQLSGMEQRAARLKSERGKSRALSARAAALTTYVTFPLEEEKQRLLTSW